MATKIILNTGLMLVILLVSVTKGKSDATNPTDIPGNSITSPYIILSVNADFLFKAANINLEEIELGKLAKIKALSTEVKDYGNMMLMDQTKASADLAALAKRKAITVPTMMDNKAMDMYNKMSVKSGSEFDRAYIDMMVLVHKDAIDLFERAASESQDSEIKSWAQFILTTLRTHLEKAIFLQKKLMYG